MDEMEEMGRCTFSETSTCKSSSTCLLAECVFTSPQTIRRTSIKLLGQKCKQTYVTLFVHDWTNADMDFTRERRSKHLHFIFIKYLGESASFNILVCLIRWHSVHWSKAISPLPKRQEIYYFIQQGCIELIKSDSNEFYIVTKNVENSSFEKCNMVSPKN